MPLTATPEQIKAHQQELEKGKITPHNLPQCPRCNVDSARFTLHAFRERRFLVIIKMIVEAISSTLARFRCVGCGKTFTDYPDFAIPHKHYTRPTIMKFTSNYVESENKTYEKALMAGQHVPGYPEGNRTMAASTIHRWVTTLGQMDQTRQKALALLLQKSPVSSICRDLAQLTIPGSKYKSQRRRALLLGCRSLLIIEPLFQSAFKSSIFTKLAIRCAFG